MARDIFGQELKVGDEIACMIKQYHRLVRAKIVAILPKQIRVEYVDPSYPNRVKIYMTWPNDVVKSPL